VVAVNKMDLVDYSQSRFEEIKEEYVTFSKKLNNPNLDISILPLSALEGDNVVNHSAALAWYKGAPLLEVLEDIDIDADRGNGEFRFPVQYVNRPNLDFRGFSGSVSSGEIKVGDDIIALPSGKKSKVARIVTFDGDLPSAQAGQAVTLTLEDEIDISRGDLLVKSTSNLTATDQFKAEIVWMTEKGLQPVRQYDIKIAGKKTVGQIDAIHHQVNINSLDTFVTDELPLNGIGLCDVSLTEVVSLDRYQDCADTGGFIFIDRLTNVTVGAGMIQNLSELSDVAPINDNVSAFEVELNALVRKHFPHWGAQDISKLLS
jgi:sulfate adenylyltransferase subunit 1